MQIKINSFLLNETNCELQMKALNDYQNETDLHSNILFITYQNTIHLLEIEFNHFLTQHTHEFYNLKKSYPNLNFPELTEINVYFAEENYYNFSADYTNSNMHGSIGVSLFEGGQNFIRNENSDFSDSFNIIISCPENEKLKKQIFDTDKYNTKEDNMLAIYNTLPHEIMHNILFIQMSGGLTPHKVSEVYEDGVFDLTPYDCALAATIVLGEDFDRFRQEEWYDEMESYVEKTSMDLTLSINNKICSFLSEKLKLIDSLM